MDGRARVRRKSRTHGRPRLRGADSRALAHTRVLRRAGQRSLTFAEAERFVDEGRSRDRISRGGFRGRCRRCLSARGVYRTSFIPQHVGTRGGGARARLIAERTRAMAPTPTQMCCRSATARELCRVGDGHGGGVAYRDTAKNPGGLEAKRPVGLVYK